MVEGKSEFLIFNVENSKAEVFMPSNDQGIILTKSNEGYWTNKNYKLISWKGYVLQQDGKAIFGGN